MKRRDDTSRRDTIILLGLLFVSVVLIVIGILNEQSIKDIMIVNPSAGQVQSGVEGGEGDGDPSGQGVNVVGNEEKPPSVASFFLYAAALFFGIVILMMVTLTALLIFIQRLRARRGGE